MENYGFWSVLPPVIAIALAMRTRQVLISLLAGILTGTIILHNAAVGKGIAGAVTLIVDLFKSDGNTKTIIFTLLMGVLIAFIQFSGGVEGFIRSVKLGEIPDSRAGLIALRRRQSLLAAATGVVVFVESNISALTTGTLFRPLFDRLKIPREKLAYIADSTSAPINILIPLNAWGGFIMGLLLLQGFANPFATMLNSMIYNFYPMLTIAMVFIIAYTGRDFGPMRKAVERADREGKLIADGAVPMVSEEITMLHTKEGVRPRAFNMFIPMALMVLSIPVMLVHTGWSSVPDDVGMTLPQKVHHALGQASGSTAVLYSVLIAITGAVILYMAQRILTLKEITGLTVKGISGMTQMALIMVMAFAIGELCNRLGTGNYVAEVSRDFLSPSLIPFIIFIISCFIAFSTGTSWGTFAIMIPIAVPMAEGFDTNVHMAIAAALGGGVFGDHCSPVSDTSIISSLASASDHIDHVKTQVPYALVTGSISAAIYLVMGFIAS